MVNILVGKTEGRLFHVTSEEAITKYKLVKHFLKLTDCRIENVNAVDEVDQTVRRPFKVKFANDGNTLYANSYTKSLALLAERISRNEGC